MSPQRSIPLARRRQPSLIISNISTATSAALPPLSKSVTSPTATVDVDSLPELGSSDIIGEAQIKHGDLKDTRNAFWINYANRAKWYKGDDTERYIDQANYLKVQVQREDNAERPFIIDGEIAVRHNIARGKLRALEKHTATLNVRRDRVDALALRQGDRFKSNSDSLSLSFVWRIIARDTSSDRSGFYKLTLENERGIYPTHFVPDAAPGPPGFTIVPTAIDNARIVELPSGLKDSSAIQVCILAQRPSQHIIGARVWVAPDLEEGVFDLIGSVLQFASYGKVAVTYPNSTADLDVATGLVVDLEGEDIGNVVSQTDAQRDDNRLLIWCNGEISSAGQVASLGGDRVRIYQRRALYGTQKGNHAIDSPVFFLYRDWIQRLAHQSFVPDLTRYFKLVPFTFGADYDIELVDHIAYHFAGNAVAQIYNLQLSTSARVAAGRIESRVAATWEFVPDQGIVDFVVAIKRSADPDSAWQVRTTGFVPSTDWLVAPATSYDVKVAPVNEHGEPGAWCDPVTIVSASISPFSITGLELVGQGNDTECRERDFKFACRLNSPSSGISVGGTIQTGVQDPAFAYILWQVFVGGVLVYDEQTTVPRFSFTYSKNEAAARLAGASGPFAQITLNVYAVDSLHNVSAAAIQTFQNSAPNAPTDLDAFAANNRTILLSWTIGPETDLDVVQILESSTNDPATAVLIATLSAKNSVFVRTLPDVSGSVTRYFWARYRDSFGNLSPLSAVASATSDPLAAAIGDIEDFEIDVTKIFLGKIVVLKGDAWTANSPGAGFIAWNAHEIIFNGVKYSIPAGNTAFKYVYWNAGTSDYTPSDEQLPLSSDRFLVYQNVGGTPRGLWNVFANAVIGSANIVDLAVKNAHIDNMAVEKLIAGFIVGKQFILQNDGSNSAAFKSLDYDPGEEGIYFGVGADGKGYLEVNNGFFRGTIVVGAGGATLNDIAAAAALGAQDPAARINAGSTTIAGGLIVVNGSTNFAAGYDPTGKIPAGQAAADVNANSTTINGGKITTNTVEAAHLKADTVLGQRFYIGDGGSIESNDYDPVLEEGFRISKEAGIDISFGVFRNGIYVRSLAPPAFVNALDGDSPLTTRNYNDNDNLSMKITAPTGRKVRFEVANDREVTINSPFWPNAANTGDGIGPSDFLGFTINYPLGNNHSRFTGRISARTAGGTGDLVLSDTVTLHLTWVPIDLLPLPAAPPPHIYKSFGTRGVAGYNVKILPGVTGADIFYSTNGGASFAGYTPGADIVVAADGSVMAYNTKDGYSPSAVATFYNTAIDPAWTDPGWNGPPGTFPP